MENISTDQWKGLVHGCMRDVEEAECALDAMVVRARIAGLSWGQIGAAAEVSRQAAWERWAGLNPPEVLAR